MDAQDKQNGWGSAQAGIWLIGIGILALTDFWWPGIMFLIGFSMLIGRSVQGAVWMFGIGILGWLDFWWPGILFVAGISIIIGARQPAKDSDPIEFAEQAPTTLPPAPPEPAPMPPAPQPQPEPQAQEPLPQPQGDWLPATCPACGAPIDPETVVWHDARQEGANCLYCTAPLSPGDRA